MESVRLATSLRHWFIFFHECWLKCIIFSYRVLVGAPKSNGTARTGGGTLVKYGAAFRCQYPGDKPCDEIIIDKTRKCRTLLEQGHFETAILILHNFFVFCYGYRCLETLY